MIDYNDIELGVSLFRRQYPLLFDVLSLDEDCKPIEDMEISMASYTEKKIKQAFIDLVRSQATNSSKKLSEDNIQILQYRWVGSSRTANFMMVEVMSALTKEYYIGIAKIKGEGFEYESSARKIALKDALNKMKEYLI